MNWVDYVIIVVLALSVLIGLWRGLITEVLALAVWIAAVWLAWLFGPRVAAAFENTIDEPSIRIILGYALCFVVVLILGALLRFFVDKLVRATGLSGSDRMLGMVFGFVRGALLVTLVVFLLGFTPFPRDSWWHQSRLLPTFTNAADWFGRHLPESVHRYLHPPAPQSPPGRLTVALGSLPGKVEALAAHAPPQARVQPAAARSVARPAGATVAPAPHSRDN